MDDLETPTVAVSRSCEELWHVLTEKTASGPGFAVHGMKKTFISTWQELAHSSRLEKRGRLLSPQRLSREGHVMMSGAETEGPRDS